MKKTMKKGISFLLSAILIFSILPIGVTANHKSSIINTQSSNNNQIIIDRTKIYSDADFIQYGDPVFFDSNFSFSNNSITVYNNSKNGNVSLTKVNKESNCPTNSYYMFEIATTGTASPALGGFKQELSADEGSLIYNIIIAKIPEGFELLPRNNSVGYKGKYEFLTSNKGTGNWELYIIEYSFGLTFQNESEDIAAQYGHSCGYYCITPVGKEENIGDYPVTYPVKWYVGYANSFKKGVSLTSDSQFETSDNSIFSYKFGEESTDTVSVTRVAKSSDCPKADGYMLKIQTDPGTTIPGYGGFVQRSVTPEAGKTYYHKFLAKIPEGYFVDFKSNYINAEFEWVTNNEGTGNWEPYVYKVSVDKNAEYLGTFGYVTLYPNGYDSEGPFATHTGNSNQTAQTTQQAIAWYVASSDIFWNYEFSADLKASDLIKGAGAVLNGHSYIRYDYSVSWHMAKSICEKIGGHLATVTSANENSTISSLLSSVSNPYYYLGGTDKAKEGTWKWITGESFSTSIYTNWNSGEPNNTDGNENYLVINNTSGKWNDYRENNVSAIKGFICEFGGNYIPIKTTVENGHIYSLFNEKLSWSDAESACVAMGGHLVSITSSDEQLIVENLLKYGAMDYYWIGATDKDSEGVWKWIDSGEVFWRGRSNGTSSGFSNWKSGEPNNNNDNNGEDYAYIYNNESPFGKWNDSSSTSCAFICEVDTNNINYNASYCYNGNKYEIYDKSLSWNDAKIVAEMKGGHLVTITSESEQSFLNTIITGNNKTKYWIGAIDYSPDYSLYWRWVTGEKFEYSNWQVKNPDNGASEEFFAHLRTDNLEYLSIGEWNDTRNVNIGTSEYRIENNGFIIEYDDYYSTVSFDENNGSEINYFIAPTVDDGWTLNKDGTLSIVKNKVSVTYDPKEETFLFDSNGVSISPSDLTRKIQFSFELPRKVEENQYLTLFSEYISGNSSLADSYACIVFEAAPIGFDTTSASRNNLQRCAVDIRLNSSGSCSNTVYPAGPFSHEQSENYNTLFVWIYIPTGGTVSFDNYKLKFSANITETPVEECNSSRMSQRIVSNGIYGDLLYTPEKSRYDFSGWLFNDENVTAESKMVCKDPHVLTANWLYHPYILTFNANGGNCETASKFVYYEQPYGEMPVPTREGYIFLGWYTKKKSGTVVKTTDVFDKLSDVTLYACWVKGENNSCGENLSWILDGNRLIISGTGDMSDYDEGEAPWSSVSNYITAIEIQDGVTGIGDNAFNNMSGVKTVEIADTVNKIGESAFDSCLSLCEVIIPDGVSIIEEDAFRNCIAISEIELPYSVDEVSDGAFDGCNGLKKITIYNPKCVMPEDLTTSAEDVEIYGYTNSTADSFAYENDFTFVSIGVYGEDDGLMWIFTTSTEILQLIGNGVMPDYPENVVPWNVVKDEIKTVIFSDNITYIGNNTLHNCANVESITFPKQLNNIGENALEGTKWFDNRDEGIVIIKSILYAYKEGIEDDEITLNKGVTRISKNFSNAFLNGVSSPVALSISNSVTDIDTKSLAYATELKTLTVNSGNPNYKSVKNVLYSKDGTKLICYPAGLDGNITIPDSVTEIEEYAFAGCLNLTTIEIGKKVTSIAENAFDSTGLTTIQGYANSYAQTYAEENGYDFVPYTSTVTFDCNDDNNTVFTVTYNTGTKIGELYIPGQEGYEFVGWYLETDDDDLLIDSDYIVNEDITVYAYWEEIPPEIPVITEISVQKMPVNTSYFVGDTLNSEGLKLIAKYSDGSVEEIDNGFYCIPSKLNKSGTQNITVTYAGFTTYFDVNVEDVVPVSLTINSLPKTVVFFVDQMIETKGLIATVTYNNGTQRVIKNSAEFEYVYDFSKASDASTVNIYYQENGAEVETFYQVKVLNSPQVYADEISCNAGETVVIPVRISGNTGLMGYVINLSYDPNVMTPYAPSRQNGTIYSNIENATPGELKVIWYDNNGITSDGELFRVPFKINSRAEAGDYSVGISYSQDDTFNMNYDNVMLLCSDSLIHVSVDQDVSIVYSDMIQAHNNSFVDVPIYIKNNVGIEEASYLSLTYDTSIFTYVECFNGLATIDRVSGATTGKLKIRLDELLEDAGDGCLITVRFNVSEKAYGEYLIQTSLDDDRWSTEDISITVNKNNVMPTISAENLKAKPGETVTIPVSISNNSGLMGYMISVDYDVNQLSFVNVTCADDWADGNFDFNDKGGTVNIVWAGTESIDSNGLLFNLSFKVNDDAEHGIATLELTGDKSNTFDKNYSLIDLEGNNCIIDIESIKLIVPYSGSKTQIDYNQKYIFNISSGLTDLNEKVETVNGYFYSLENKSTFVGTGTSVLVKSEDSVVDSYTVILFGDVNGDGWYDGMDAMLVSCLANGMLSKDDVGEAVYMAADCNHDGVIDDADVELLEQAGVFLASVDQSESEEELLITSSAYVEYLSLIEQSVETETVEAVEETPTGEPIDSGFTFNFFDAFITFIKEFIVIVKSVLTVIW